MSPARLHPPGALRHRIAYFLGALITPLGVCAQEPPNRPGEPPAAEPTAELVELHTAVRAGLAYLAAHQNADGSFIFETNPTHRGEKILILRAPVAVTALGSLAFMAYGANPRRGEFSAALRRALDYLVQHVHPEGSTAAGYIGVRGDEFSRMHGHGFATLALAQAYGQYHRSGEEGQRLRSKLQAAVGCIAAAQSQVGGWYYQPTAGSGHENSITICVVQALRAARDAGTFVDRGVIERAIGYVKRCRKEDGSFHYGTGNLHSSVALTAASIATLIAMGIHDGDIIQQGTEWIAENTPYGLAGFPEYEPGQRYFFPHYERLYVALAYHRHPEEKHWKAWFPHAAARILRAQAGDDQAAIAGSWPRNGMRPSVYGRAYETAVNCLVLSIPFGYLPAFQR